MHKDLRNPILGLVVSTKNHSQQTPVVTNGLYGIWCHMLTRAMKQDEASGPGREIMFGGGAHPPNSIERLIKEPDGAAGFVH